MIYLFDYQKETENEDRLNYLENFWMQKKYINEKKS